jgi:hypothetical protein
MDNQLIVALMTILAGAITIYLVYVYLEESRREAEEIAQRQQPEVRIGKITRVKHDAFDPDDYAPLAVEPLDLDEYETEAPALLLVGLYGPEPKAHAVWDDSNFTLCGQYVADSWAVFGELHYLPAIGCDECRLKAKEIYHGIHD